MGRVAGRDLVGWARRRIGGGAGTEGVDEPTRDAAARCGLLDCRMGSRYPPQHGPRGVLLAAS
jgi:hypothetical protein